MKPQLVIFPLIYVALFVVSVVHCIHTGQWQSVEGKVTSGDVHHQKGGYSLDLQYTYKVGGFDYSGQEITGDSECYVTREEAQSHLEDYLAGATKKVFYDPQDPSRNTLFLGLQMYWPIGVMVLLLPVFIALTLAGTGAKSWLYGYDETDFPPKD
jgi:Protein of unknown function (DUF3592)